MVKILLTIAGSDPLAGGGLQTDLKTFEHYGLFGLSAISCIGYMHQDQFLFESVSSQAFLGQLETVKQHLSLDGIKIGLLYDIEHIKSVADFLNHYPGIPVILDPVFAFKETDQQLQKNYVILLKEQLIPKATIVTPNILEASLILDIEIKTVEDLVYAAKLFYKQYGVPVVIKGGSTVTGDQATDIFYDGTRIYEFHAPKLSCGCFNGAGCSFAASILSMYVCHHSLKEAISISKSYVYQGLINGVYHQNGQEGSVWFCDAKKEEVKDED